MPTPSKPRRQQPRFDPNRGNAPPEMIELVDPSWILKALAAMLALGLLCAVVTMYFFRHYQAHHPCAPASTQNCTVPAPALKTRGPADVPAGPSKR